MKTIFWTAVIVLAIVLVGVVSSAYLAQMGEKSRRGEVADYPIIFAIAATGVITFFGTLVHQLRNTNSEAITESSLRIATTTSLTITYFVFVGYTTFYDADKFSELAHATVTSFTTIVGIVIAFYFGSSAYLEAKTGGETDTTAAVDSQNPPKKNPKKT